MILAILLKTTETYDLNLSRESLAQDASNDNINPAPYKQQSPDYYCYTKFFRWECLYHHHNNAYLITIYCHS